MSNPMPWLHGLSNRLTALVSEEIARLIVAAAIVVTGYLVARIVGYLARRYFRRASTRLILFFHKSSGRPQPEPALSLAGGESVAVSVATGIVFWLVLVLFLSIAASFLGLTAVSTWFSGLASYLPRALAAAAAVLLGIFTGRFVGGVITSAAESLGLHKARVLGRATQLTILLLSIFIAVDELGIEITMLIVVTAIALAAALGSIALAFGLGAQTAVANLVAAHYLTKWYQVGQTVRVGELDGRIIHLLPTAVVLQTVTGKLHVPAKLFAESATLLLPEKSAP